MANHTFRSARSPLVADLLFSIGFAAFVAFSTSDGWSVGLRAGVIALVIGLSISLVRFWDYTKRQQRLS